MSIVRVGGMWHTEGGGVASARTTMLTEAKFVLWAQDYYSSALDHEISVLRLKAMGDHHLCEFQCSREVNGGALC